MGDRANQPVLVPLSDPDMGPILRAAAQMVIDSLSASDSAIEGFNEYVSQIRGMFSHVGPYAIAPWTTNPGLDPRTRSTYMIVGAEYAGILGVDLDMAQLDPAVRAAACVHAPDCPPNCPHHQSYIPYADVRAHGRFYERTLVFTIVAEFYTIGEHVSAAAAVEQARAFADFTSENLGQFDDHRGRWFAHLFRNGHPVFADFERTLVTRTPALLPLAWMTGAVSCPVAQRASMTDAERHAAGIVDTDSGGCFVVRSGASVRTKRPIDFLHPGVDVPFASIKKNGRISCTLHKMTPATDNFSRTLNTITIVPPAARRRGERGALRAGADKNTCAAIYFSASWMRTQIAAAIVFAAFGVCTDRALLDALGYANADEEPSAERVRNHESRANDCALFALEQFAHGKVRVPSRYGQPRLTLGDHERRFAKLVGEIDELNPHHRLTVAVRRAMAEVGARAAPRILAARYALATAARTTVYGRRTSDNQDVFTADCLDDFDGRIRGLLFEHVEGGVLERLALLRHMCVRALSLLDGAQPDAIDALGNKQQVGPGRIMLHATLLAARQGVLEWVERFSKTLGSYKAGISPHDTATLTSIVPEAVLGSSATRLRSTLVNGTLQINNTPIFHVTADNPANPNEALAYTARVQMHPSTSEESGGHRTTAEQRSVHVTHYGYLDAAHTPDGKNAGECLHRAFMCRFTTGLTPAQRVDLVAFVTGRHEIDGQSVQLILHFGDLAALKETPGESPTTATLRAHLGAFAGVPGTIDQTMLLLGASTGSAALVLLDGAPIGLTLVPEVLARLTRRWRAQHWDRRYVEVVHDIQRGTVEILTNNGRFTRLVYALTYNPADRSYAAQLSRRIIAASGDAWHRQRRIGVRALYEAGLVVYLGPRESEYALIATGPGDERLRAPPKTGYGIFTHMEISPLSVLGFVTSLEPHPNDSQAPRVTFSATQMSSTIGSQMFAEHGVLHVSWQMLYPQRPTTATATEDQTQVAHYGSTTNLVIAIATRFDNQEDSIVVARATSERGAGAAVRCVRTTFEENHVSSNNAPAYVNHTFFVHPKDPSAVLPEGVVYAGARPGRNLLAVGDDGLPEVGCMITNGAVLLGRVTIEETDAGLRAVDSSIVHRGAPVFVRAVHISSARSGGMCVTIDLERCCWFVVGSKGLLRNAQKGVVSRLVDPANTCYIISSNPALHGMRIDAMINPHSIPSRMTICVLLQMLIGFAAVASGRRSQTTAFARLVHGIDSVEPLAPTGSDYDGPAYIDWQRARWDDAHAEPVMATNQSYGLDPFSEYLLADPCTGLPLGEPGRPTFHTVAIVPYTITHHRADEKIQATGRARRDAYGMVIGGRKHDGGLRWGEMERDCMISHGASGMIKSYSVTNSDGVDVYICGTCGLLAYLNYRTREPMCTSCRSGAAVRRIVMPVAMRLLTQEMAAIGIAMRPRMEARQAPPAPPVPDAPPPPPPELSDDDDSASMGACSEDAAPKAGRAGRAASASDAGSRAPSGAPPSPGARPAARRPPPRRRSSSSSASVMSMSDSAS